ncbi:MAG: hypothetical protein WCG44_00180 [bacterium]
MRHSSITVSRSLYQIGMITLISAIIWIGIGIYTASSKEILIDIDQSMLQPINPGLDQNTIKELSERLKIEVDLTSLAKVESASQSPSVLVVEPVPAENGTASATIESEGTVR